jgi:hypothetical protein
MVIVSEQTERNLRRKQKESANVIVRGNAPGAARRNEAVTTAVGVEGKGTENGNVIVEGRIVIMTAEVAEGQLLNP